jgi:putative selenium metabolism hydrolase
MLTIERKMEVTKLCQELIRVPSYPGEEKEVVSVIQKYFRDLGYDDFFTDKYGNVVGHIKGNNQGKTILFDGHIDTVPIGDSSKWKHPPFGAEIENGKIYGRGASDMKGQLSSIILVAAYFANDTNREFSGDIYVAGIVYEELLEGVASKIVCEKVKPDYVIIGEASELSLKVGQRGRGEIVIETHGISAHSSTPEDGINAVYKMSKIIQKIQKIQPPTHPQLGKGILELTDIKSQPYPGLSVIPDYCRITLDRRLLAGETEETVIKPINDVIAELKNHDTELKVEAFYASASAKCYTGETIQGKKFFKAWIIDEKDEFVQAAYKGLRKAGLAPNLSYYSFCTNGSYYAGEQGIKTIGFGPSEERLAHIVDEYIEQDQLYKGAEGYYGILKSILK